MQTLLRTALLLLLLFPTVASADARWVTFGYDSGFKGVPGMSAGMCQHNIKRGLIGLQRVLAPTRYQFRPAGSAHPQLRIHARDLRSTRMRNTYGYYDRRGNIVINTHPISKSTGRIIPWNNDSMASIVSHETLHYLAPRLTHQQMSPIENEAASRRPRFGDYMVPWPVR